MAHKGKYFKLSFRKIPWTQGNLENGRILLMLQMQNTCRYNASKKPINPGASPNRLTPGALLPGTELKEGAP